MMATADVNAPVIAGTLNQTNAIGQANGIPPRQLPEIEGLAGK
jgi:hypothetical protein